MMMGTSFSSFSLLYPWRLLYSPASSSYSILLRLRFVMPARRQEGGGASELVPGCQLACQSYLSTEQTSPISWEDVVWVSATDKGVMSGSGRTSLFSMHLCQGSQVFLSGGQWLGAGAPLCALSCREWRAG